MRIVIFKTYVFMSDQNPPLNKPSLHRKQTEIKHPYIDLYKYDI